MICKLEAFSLIGSFALCSRRYADTLGVLVVPSRTLSKNISLCLLDVFCSLWASEIRLVVTTPEDRQIARTVVISHETVLISDGGRIEYLFLHTLVNER